MKRHHLGNSLFSLAVFRGEVSVQEKNRNSFPQRTLYLIYLQMSSMPWNEVYYKGKKGIKHVSATPQHRLLIQDKSIYIPHYSALITICSSHNYWKSGGNNGTSRFLKPGYGCCPGQQPTEIIWKPDPNEEPPFSPDTTNPNRSRKESSRISSTRKLLAGNVGHAAIQCLSVLLWFVCVYVCARW